MKILLKIYLLTFTCFSIISCEKDSSSLLAGTWKMTDIHSDDGTTSKSYSLETDSLLNTYIFHGAEYNVIINFNDDPNKFTQSGLYKQIKTSNNQGILTTEEIYQLEDANGNWSISNSTLFLESGNLNHETEYQILELSKSHLKLKELFDTYQIGMSYPYPVHLKATVYSTFEKQ